LCSRPRIPTFRAQKDLEQVEEQKPSYCLLSLSSLTSEKNPVLEGETSILLPALVCWP
jgi:hypothetical protein